MITHPARKIVSQLFVSLDGVMEAPEEWHFPYFDERMAEVVQEQFDRSDILLLGRATYEIFAASWPHRGSEVPLADQINSMPKLVASSSLREAEWNNTTILREPATAELAALKAQPGRNIAVSGSATLVRSLIETGLLDELQLLVHPVVLGIGQRWYDEDLAAPMELLSSEVFPSGVVHLVYQPAEK